MAKATDNFKETIKKYIEKKASEDEFFKTKFDSESKNIDDCIKYILNTVKKSGVNGFTDSEVFSMAEYYYISEDVNVGGDLKCNVVVNHTVELTPEEIEEQKQKAKDKVFNDQREKLTKKPEKKIPVKAEEPKKEESFQPTLF